LASTHCGAVFSWFFRRTAVLTGFFDDVGVVDRKRCESVNDRIL